MTKKPVPIRRRRTLASRVRELETRMAETQAAVIDLLQGQTAQLEEQVEALTAAAASAPTRTAEETMARAIDAAWAPPA